MAAANVSSVDFLVNGAGVEPAVIVLREQGQVGWLGIELGALRPGALAIGSMTARAIQQELDLALIGVLRAHDGDARRCNDRGKRTGRKPSASCRVHAQNASAKSHDVRTPLAQ